MGKHNHNSNTRVRTSDSILPWIRANVAWLAPGVIVAGVAIGTWFKTEFATSIINPQSMLEFKEKSVNRVCRAAVTECFSEPDTDLKKLWNCLDKRVGK